MSDYHTGPAQPNGQQTAPDGVPAAAPMPDKAAQHEPAPIASESAAPPAYQTAPVVEPEVVAPSAPMADAPAPPAPFEPETVASSVPVASAPAPAPVDSSFSAPSAFAEPPAPPAPVDVPAPPAPLDLPAPPAPVDVAAPPAPFEPTVPAASAPEEVAQPEPTIPAASAPEEFAQPEPIPATFAPEEIAQTAPSAFADSAAPAPVESFERSLPEPAAPIELPAPSAPIESSLPAPSAPVESMPVESADAPTLPAPVEPTSFAAPAPVAHDEDVIMSDAATPVVPPTAEPLSNAGEHPPALVEEIRAKVEQPQSAVQFDEQARAEPAQPYEGPMDINAAQLKFAQSTLKSLKGRREALAFLKPVDAVALGIPQYHQIITKPMDFGTIDIKLALTALVLKPNSKPGDKAKQASQFNLDPSQDVYKQISEFDADVRQVFVNCATFNGPDSPYTENARVLEAAFDKYMKDVPPASQPSEVVEARVRRPSNPVPTIRRSESDVGGRPKREIHPPPPKDLPYTNEPQSSTSEMRKAAKRKAAKKGGKMTAREEAYWAKVAGEELRYCTRVIDDLLKPTHEAVAWVFYDIPSMDFDWAPVYFEMIKKPTSLKLIQKNIRAGKYADADDFDADMQLLIQNCFTFNPPGSDVYIMGDKLKKVYEEKMSRKPVPPPMVADYEESDDEDDDDEDDGVNPEFLATLQEQISQLSGTLAMLEGNKTPQSAALIANTKAMLASLQESYASSGTKKGKKGGMKRKASDAGLKKKSKAKSLGSPGAGTSADYLPPKKPKTAPKKKPQQTQQASPSSSKKISSRKDSDEDIRNVTYEQKEELAAKITELSEERLDGAIRIINEDKPPNQNDEEEIELDIDELSPKTLYKLYKYVVRPKKPVPVPQKGNGKSAPLDGRKRGTGGIKKKNLDEGEEAERIARLQQQLEQFGNPDASVSARGHDDLVHSESSSDESASDSDSDA